MWSYDENRTIDKFVNKRLQATNLDQVGMCNDNNNTEHIGLENFRFQHASYNCMESRLLRYLQSTP